MPLLPILVSIHSEAIGHFVRETEILHYKISVNNLDSEFRIYLCHQKRVSNSFFLEVLGDKYRICTWPMGTVLMKILNRVSKKHKSINELLASRPNSYLGNIHRYPTKLLSDARVMQLRAHILENHAELDKKKTVVVALRDEGYDKFLDPRYDRITQSYRNAELKHFLPMLKMLNNVGYKIVRLGRHNSYNLTELHNEITEISHFNCANPALCDFAIIQNAKFIISTGTGIDDVALLFRKPIIYVNVAPFGDIPQTLPTKGILATDYFDNRGRKITLEGLFEKGLHLENPTKYIRSGEITLAPKGSDKLRRYLELLIDEGFEKNPEEVAHLAEIRGIGKAWKSVVY